MTRQTSTDCLLCRRRGYLDQADRTMVALHRMEHRRADRRRAQYRAAKQRKKLNRGRAVDLPAGSISLHDVGCHREGGVLVCYCTRPIVALA